MNRMHYHAPSIIYHDRLAQRTCSWDDRRLYRVGDSGKAITMVEEVVMFLGML